MAARCEFQYESQPGPPQETTLTGIHSFMVKGGMSWIDASFATTEWEQSGGTASFDQNDGSGRVRVWVYPDSTPAR